MAGLFDDVLEPQQKPRAAVQRGGLFDDVLDQPAGAPRNMQDLAAMGLDPAALPDAMPEYPAVRDLPLGDVAGLAPVRANPLQPRTTNPFEGARARVYDLAGSGIRGIANVGERLGDALEGVIPLSGLSPEQIANEQQLAPLFKASDFLRQKADEVGYQPTTDIAGVKEALNPNANANRARAAEEFGEPGNYTEIGFGDRLKTIGSFAGEQAIGSIPDMAAAVGALPAYVLGRTQEIGERRVANDARTGEPTLTDLGAALPAAAIESTLERFATKGLGGSEASTVLGRIASELGLQTGTEATEEVIANLGESLGTERGVVGQEVADAALAGGLGGAAVGGGGVAANEIGRALAARGAAPAVGDAPEISVTGGTVATPEDMARDAEIVRQFRERGAAPAAAAEPTSELDELLLRNLPPDAVEAAANATPEEAEQAVAALGDMVAPAIQEPAAPAADARWRRPESAASPAPAPASPASSPVNAEASQTFPAPAVETPPTPSTLRADAPPEQIVEPKQAPIAQFRREAADIESTLPAPVEGTTRLWRGNRPDEIGKATQFTNDLPGIALPFRKAYGGELSYVDVPTEQLPEWENRAGSAPGAEFNLPDDLAARAVSPTATIASVATQEATPDAIVAPELTAVQAADDTPDAPAQIMYGKRRGATEGATGQPSSRAQERVDRMFADRSGVQQEAPGPAETKARTEGAAQAERLGIREAVDNVLGKQASRVEYLSSYDGLPENLRRGVESRNKLGRKGVTAALYDPQTQRVFLFTNVIQSPDRAVWHALHEIAGHDGLRKLLGDKLDPALHIALQNPTVSALADEIAKQRKLTPSQRTLAAEEALAELAAAVRTGDYDHIQERYGVPVPEGVRARVKASIDNFLKRLKALLDDLFGRHVFLDEDVRSLLEAAWQAVDQPAARVDGEALESVAADQTDTPEFRRWFGDSKVVDENGEPLVVYHGTNRRFSKINMRKGAQGLFWTTSDRDAIERGDVGASARGVVMPLYAKIEKPAGWAEYDKFGIGELKRDGYDGLMLRDSDGTVTVAVFDRNQIKSADRNRGTFDQANPSILESVQYTPAQAEALTKAGMPVDTRTRIDKVRDGLRDEWTKVREAARSTDAFKQATFDRFHGLRMAEGQLGLTNPETSPYIAARMTAGLSSNMEALLLYGAPKWDGGILAIDSNTVGLLDALKPVQGKVDAWLGWMVGRRAKLLKSQGRENNLTDADISALLSLAQGNEAAFQKAATDYLKIKNNVLDVAEQAGLIDPVARAAWDHAEYIPFYRAENEGVIGPGTRKGLAGQNAGIRTLKGGEQALADPLANIVRNFSKLLDAAGKNRATLLAVDQLGGQFFKPAAREMQPATIPMDQVKKHLQEQGVPDATIAGMPPAALKGVQRMLSIVPPTGEDVVRVMREGKAEYYHVLDPLVLRALTAFKAANKNMAIKPFIWFKRLLTTGVTTTAEFVGANFIRDSGSAWVISDDRFIPGWDSLKGIGNTLRNDPGTRDMMMAGATFLGGNFYDGNADSAAAAVRRALRNKGLKDRDIEGFMGTIARSPLQLWDAWLKLSGAVENANRRAVYDAALKSGRTRTEAAYMARDLMDFAMQGDAAWVQFFSDVLPFFNARLQGMYKLGRRAGTKEGRRAIVLRGGVLVMASAALYAWNMAMYGDAYDDLEEWDKDAYWHVAPGTEYHTRIPKPFELGLIFGTAPERMMQAIRNVRSGDGDTPSATYGALARGLTSTLVLPIPIPGAQPPVPQALLPIVEQWANKRFFTERAIEKMGDDKLLPEARFEWYTSDTAKAISSLIGNETNMSPKRIEHLWNGYTAGLGGYVLDATDAIVRMVTDAPERPEMARKDWPILGRFLRGGSPGSTKYTEQFYTRLREAEQIEQTIKEYTVAGRLDDAKELERENAELLGARVASKSAKGGFLFEKPKALRKVRGQLSKLREEMEEIATSRTLSPYAKRQQIDDLTAKRNRLVKDTVTGRGQAPDTGPKPSSLPESRRAEYIGIGKGGQATAAPDVLKGAKNAPKMVMVGDYSGIQSKDVRQSFDDGALGVFDPDTKTAYVTVGLDPAEAKFVAYHEIAGHYGLQGALGSDYEAVLNRARQNPLIKELADKMHASAYQKHPNRLALTEEALSELAAARKADDYARIEDRWGVKVPDAAKPGLSGMLRRVVQMTKRTLSDLTGDEPDAYDDDQVYELIEDAWKYVEG